MSIVARLHRGVNTNSPPDITDSLMAEAADEIERLRAAIEELVQANKDLGQGDIVETITLRDGAWDKIEALANEQGRCR